MRKIKLVLLVAILCSITITANAGEVEKGIRAKDIPEIVYDKAVDFYHWIFGEKEGKTTDKEPTYTFVDIKGNPTTVNATGIANLTPVDNLLLKASKNEVLTKKDLENILIQENREITIKQLMDGLKSNEYKNIILTSEEEFYLKSMNEENELFTKEDFAPLWERTEENKEEIVLNYLNKGLKYAPSSQRTHNRVGNSIKDFAEFNLQYPVCIYKNQETKDTMDNWNYKICYSISKEKECEQEIMKHFWDIYKLDEQKMLNLNEYCRNSDNQTIQNKYNELMGKKANYNRKRIKAEKEDNLYDWINTVYDIRSGYGDTNKITKTGEIYLPWIDNSIIIYNKIWDDRHRSGYYAATDEFEITKGKEIPWILANWNEVADLFPKKTSGRGTGLPVQFYPPYAIGGGGG